MKSKLKSMALCAVFVFVGAPCARATIVIDPGAGYTSWSVSSTFFMGETSGTTADAVILNGTTVPSSATGLFFAVTGIPVTAFTYTFSGATGVGTATWDVVDLRYEDNTSFGTAAFASVDNSPVIYTISGLSGQNVVTAVGLTYAAVPEPSAALLGGVGILALLRRRR